MRTYEHFLVLLAELDNDANEMQRILIQNTRAWERILNGAKDPIDWGALGFTIQRLYGLFENYCLRISKFFENNLPKDRWHKALLEKMTLDIPSLRPALFTNKESFSDANELLKFRHRLRNLYGEDLDERKTTEMQRITEQFFKAFPAIHSEFSSKILAIAKAVR